MSRRTCVLGDIIRTSNFHAPEYIGTGSSDKKWSSFLFRPFFFPSFEAAKVILGETTFDVLMYDAIHMIV